jgi:hypothetical protein
MICFVPVSRPLAIDAGFHCKYLFTQIVRAGSVQVVGRDKPDSVVL